MATGSGAAIVDGSSPGVDGGGEDRPLGGRERSLGARPLVLPETFDGTGCWNDWYFHFENVARVNGWDDAQKLQWLRVRVTGRAQKALHRLPEAVANSYEATRDALRARFEPESRYTRYQAEFQLRRKKATEGWADLADDLRGLADKAYPTLQDEARERLALNAYLAQLPQPQVSFSVRQKQPSNLDEAVSATLEMESYLPPQGASSVGSVCDGPTETEVGAVDKVTHLSHVVEKLVEQVERLQTQMSETSNRRPTPGYATRQLRGPRGRQRRGFSGECWNCGQVGHLARNCLLPQSQGPPQSHPPGN